MSFAIKLVGTAIITGLGLAFGKKHFEGPQYQSDITMEGKTVLITGANEGIGREAARELARRKARLIMACRNMDKCERVADEIRKETGNPNIVTKNLDLSSLSSVRRLADDVNRTEPHLHVLINNAGVMRPPFTKTAEGFELQFGVNHLGHFLLTNLLMEKLSQSGSSRVVTVASRAHTRRPKLDFDNLNAEKGYKPDEFYAASKLCNMLFTLELQRRIAHRQLQHSVTPLALHPGVIWTTLFTSWVNPTLNMILRPFTYYFLKSPKSGAQTTIFCAVDPLPVNQPIDPETGLAHYYFADCAPKTPAPQARDVDAAKRLWEISARLVDLPDNALLK